MRISKNIVLIVLLAVFGLGKVNAQLKTVLMETGVKAFRAQSDATSFAWYINSVLQVGENTDSLKMNWLTGNYWITVGAEDINGCTGDTVSIALQVVDDITDTTHVRFTVDSVSVCANDGSGSDEVPATLSLMNYTLSIGETYIVDYTIDGVTLVTSDSLSLQTNAVVFISSAGLSAGDHTVKIVKLRYRPSGSLVEVDFTTDTSLPTLNIHVSEPAIGEIKFE
jgi:hypothetical protein